MNKPVTSLRERELARAKAAEEQRLRELCADLQAQMEEAGWTGVSVRQRGPFIAISGDDPNGINQSGCMVDGQALVDHLVQEGVQSRQRKPPPPAAPVQSRTVVSDMLRALMRPGESIADAKARLTGELRDEYSEVNNKNMLGEGEQVWALGKTVAQRLGELSALFDELARLGDVRPANG